MSDTELLSTNRVFSFQNNSTTLNARGPNINNVLTSTMNMPRNYEQRRAESNYDQRSLGYRREASPTSIVSACDARQRKFNRSYYGRGITSNRSVYNDRRPGSSMSMRSMDSNTTMCATDIVMALKNSQFSKYDMRMIKEAYDKLIKHKVRKRIEKRRNRLFLKGCRRKSGYDSGELGSNSSVSSDDNKSTRTLNHKKMSSCRSTKTDVVDLRRTIKNCDMVNDCSVNFRQISRPANMNSSRSLVSSFKSMIEKPIAKSMYPINFNKTQSLSSTLQDRFKNGFLLPSQTCDKPIAASSESETEETPTPRNKHENIKANREQVRPSSPQETSNDNDEIFTNVTTIERPPVKQKMKSYDDDDDICLPVQKRPKLASPCKKISLAFNNSTVVEKAKNDFEFAKPAFPVRRSANQKAKEKILSNFDIINAKEELIAKSRTPLSDSIIHPLQVHPIPQPKLVEETEQVLMDKMDESTINQNTTDLSMRPSFIKRKLFTQRMEVTDKTNDVANSPQNSVYGDLQREKNKTRKLVTSQYCLSRDIQSENNNFLNLIHKIVPAEKMNTTTQTNKTAVNDKSEDNDDNWDVTSIISAWNNDVDGSDTFTDEDTLLDGKGLSSPKGTEKIKKKPPRKKPAKIVKKSPLKVIKNIQKAHLEKNGTPKTTVQKCIKSFWDSDFESDAEGIPARSKEFKENRKSENAVTNATSKVNFQCFSSKEFPVRTIVGNNASVMNTLVNTTQKFNKTNKTFKLFTHRNNNLKVKKNMHESFKEDAISVIEPESKTQKVTKRNTCLDLSNQANAGKSMQENKPKTNPETKKTPEKIKKTVKKQNNKQDNGKSDVKLMQQKKKADSEKNKSDNQKKDTLIDKKPRKNKKVETEDEKQNKKSDVNPKQNNKTKNKEAATQLNTSIRPIRSCRMAKLDETLKSNANNTINRSLRSRDITLTIDGGVTKNVVERRTTAKNNKKTTKNELSLLSDTSFSLAQDKKTTKQISSSSKPQEIDTSDISFSIHDKDSPKNNQGNSDIAKINTSYKKKAIVNLAFNNLLNQRSTRNRLANKRYDSLVWA